MSKITLEAMDMGTHAYDHDVFVSYSSADNAPHSGELEGWVSLFVAGLRIELRRKLGGREPRVQMGLMEPNVPVTNELFSLIRRSKTLLVVLSPAYCGSDWCQRELTSFVAHAQATGNERSIFPIEVESVALEDRPLPLKQLTPLSFLYEGQQVGYPIPDLRAHPRYWALVNEVARLLATRLRTAVETVAQRHVVVLADAADDVDNRHAAMAEVLSQRPDVVLLPAHPHSRKNAPDYESGIRHDLRLARLHVQLLSLSPGPSLPPGQRRIVELQATFAEENMHNGGAPLLRWLDPAVNPTHVSDPSLAAILQDGSLPPSRLSFCEFQRTVLRTVDSFGSGPLPSPRAPERMPALAATVPLAASGASAYGGLANGTSHPEAAGLTIYVHAAPEDAANAEIVAAYLVASGVTVISPMVRTSESGLDCFRAHESTIGRCQGVVLVYGHGREDAVLAAFQCAQRVFGVRRPNVWGAVLDLPPVDKRPWAIRHRNLMPIGCRQHFDPSQLLPFYAALRAAPAELGDARVA